MNLSDSLVNGRAQLKGNLGVSLLKNGDGSEIHWPRHGSPFIPDCTSPTLCHKGHGAVSLTWANRRGTVSQQDEQSSQYAESFTAGCMWKCEQC